MSETLFTRIRDREIPADIVYEDEEILAFRDINPQAPTHILIVPTEVIPTVNDLTPEHTGLIGRMYLVAQQLAHADGIAGSGYRLVMNAGEGAGQTVFHLHLHLIGGRTLHWPPG